MGWSSGSEIAQVVIETVKKEVECPKTRLRIYKKFLAVMESHDWDCQYEAEGIDEVFDKLLDRGE